MPSRGEGLRVRFARLPQTPRDILRRPLYLPALTGDFAWTEEALSTMYDTVSAGQFSQSAGGDDTARRLRTQDLDVLTLWWDAEWLVDHSFTEEDVRRELFGILRSKKPVEMLATLRLGSELPEELRMNVKLTSVTRTLPSGEPDRRNYTVHVEEWRNDQVSRKREGRGKVHLPTTHKLTATDTLYSLSHRYYGSSLAWQAIANANGIHGWGQKTPLTQSQRYKVGDTVKIPAPPVATIDPPSRRDR